MESSLKNMVLVLTTITLISSAAVGGVYLITKEPIANAKVAAVNDADVLAEVKAVEELINGKGRVLLRQSGTEPVVRVMVESEEHTEEYVDRVLNKIIEKGHKAE